MNDNRRSSWSREFWRLASASLATHSVAGGELHALADEAGADRQRDREVGFAGAGTSSRRTTHVVDQLPARVRLVGAPGELRDVELEVLGWRTEHGETMLRCRLVDG